MSDLFDDLNRFFNENNTSLNTIFNNLISQNSNHNEKNVVYDTEISDSSEISEDDYNKLIVRLNDIEITMKEIEKYLSNN